MLPAGGPPELDRADEPRPAGPLGRIRIDQDMTVRGLVVVPDGALRLQVEPQPGVACHGHHRLIRGLDGRGRTHAGASGAYSRLVPTQTVSETFDPKSWDVVPDH